MSGRPPIHPDNEERLATDMSRELEALAAESAIRPPVGFVDRVMAAVAAEPLPQPARAFGLALLAGRLRAAGAAFGDSLRVVVGGSTPLAVRAQALGLVLVVAIGSIAVAGGAAVGAFDLLTANPPPPPGPTTQIPSELLSSPMPTPSPSATHDERPYASPTSEPTETPKSIETPGATERPRTDTPRPTESDDHGDGSGGGDSGSGGSGSDGSGGGGDQTPTPVPTESDDHGGTDG